MNINDIRFNVYRNRWIGCMLQEKGYKVIPTIQWALEDTYDICFSGVEKGSVIIISTLGCIHNKDTFINKQIKDLEERIKQSSKELESGEKLFKRQVQSLLNSEEKDIQYII